MEFTIRWPIRHFYLEVQMASGCPTGYPIKYPIGYRFRHSLGYPNGCPIKIDVHWTSTCGIDIVLISGF